MRADSGDWIGTRALAILRSAERRLETRNAGTGS
jgi:hypothetical protein